MSRWTWHEWYKPIAIWIGLGLGVVFVGYLLVVAAFLLGLWH